MGGGKGPRVRSKSFFQKTLEVPGGAFGVGLTGVDGGHEMGRARARGARMTEGGEHAEEGCEQEGEGRGGRGHLGGIAGYSRIVYTMSTTLIK